MPTSYQLKKWRNLVILKDSPHIPSFGKRVPRCVLCHKVNKLPSMQCHHLWPKSKYPNLALYLSNGVLLCVSCHIDIIHGGNAFLDLTKHERWKDFVEFFATYNKQEHIIKFVEKNQRRLAA